MFLKTNHHRVHLSQRPLQAQLQSHLALTLRPGLLTTTGLDLHQVTTRIRTFKPLQPDQALRLVLQEQTVLPALLVLAPADRLLNAL